MNFYLLPESQQMPPVDAHRPRKAYHRPILEVLGDLRTMTLGVSPTGIKDSGVGTLYQKRRTNEYIPDFPPLPGETPLPGDPPIY
jgi:hypothetical protein